MSSSSSFDFFKRSNIFSMATTVRTWRSWRENVTTETLRKRIYDFDVEEKMTTKMIKYLWFKWRPWGFWEDDSNSVLDNNDVVIDNDDDDDGDDDNIDNDDDDCITMIEPNQADEVNWCYTHQNCHLHYLSPVLVNSTKTSENTRKQQFTFLLSNIRGK